jgi:Fe-S-cluster containining protein
VAGLDPKAGCKRTGHCCKRLVADNVQGLRSRVRHALAKDDRGAHNMTDKFLTGWELSAEAATKAGKKLFTCPFLSDDNVCDLQDNKPHICSASLSPASLVDSYLNINKFFHHKCGWLEGAPDDFIRGVELQTKCNDLPVGQELDKVEHREVSDIQHKYISSTQLTLSAEGVYTTSYHKQLTYEAQDVDYDTTTDTT